jgi:hypothetical protein
MALRCEAIEDIAPNGVRGAAGTRMSVPLCCVRCSGAVAVFVCARKVVRRDVCVCESV